MLKQEEYRLDTQKNFLTQKQVLQTESGVWTVRRACNKEDVLLFWLLERVWGK